MKMLILSLSFSLTLWLLDALDQSIDWNAAFSARVQIRLQPTADGIEKGFTRFVEHESSAFTGHLEIIDAQTQMISQKVQSDLTLIQFKCTSALGMRLRERERKEEKNQRLFFTMYKRRVFTSVLINFPSNFTDLLIPSLSRTANVFAINCFFFTIRCGNGIPEKIARTYPAFSSLLSYLIVNEEQLETREDQNSQLLTSIGDISDLENR
jgi:hypothetical protein